MKLLLIITIISVAINVVILVSIARVIFSVFKKAKNKETANRFFRIFFALAVVLTAVSCKGVKSTHVSYLVTVETNKPKSIEPFMYESTDAVDSTVIRNFGHAISGFHSDSLFDESPYFRIETLNKTVYSQQKYKRLLK